MRWPASVPIRQSAWACRPFRNPPRVNARELPLCAPCHSPGTRDLAKPLRRRLQDAQRPAQDHQLLNLLMQPTPTKAKTTGSGMMLTERDRRIIEAIHNFGIATREQIAAHLE